MGPSWHNKLSSMINKLNIFIDKECTALKLIKILAVGIVAYLIYFTLNLIMSHNFYGGDWFDYYLHGAPVFVRRIHILFLFQLLHFPFHRFLMFTFGGGGACLFIAKYILEFTWVDKCKTIIDADLLTRVDKYKAIIDADFSYMISVCIIIFILAMLDKYVHLIADRFTVWGILFFYINIEMIFSLAGAEYFMNSWKNANYEFHTYFLILLLISFRYTFLFLRGYLKKRRDA